MSNHLNTHHSEYFFLPPHHEDEIKIIDGRLLVRVGVLAAAIYSGSVRFKLESIDITVLENSISRTNFGVPPEHRDLLPLTLERRIVIILDESDFYIADGRSRARILFESGADSIPALSVQAKDARDIGALIDLTRNPPSIDGQFLEATSRHRMNVGHGSQTGGHLAAIPVPPAGGKGRKPREEGHLMLYFTFIFLYNKILRHLKSNDKERISLDEYLDKIQLLSCNIGELEYDPCITIQPSSLFVNQNNAIKKIETLSEERKIQRNKIISRIESMNYEELKKHFILTSRALARSDEVIAFGREIRRASEKNLNSDSFARMNSEKPVFLRNTSIDIRSMTIVSRLTGENISIYYTGEERNFELCQWYAKIDDIVTNKKYELISKYMAMEFSWWIEASNEISFKSTPTSQAYIAMCWQELFHIIIYEYRDKQQSEYGNAIIINEIIAKCTDILRRNRVTTT